MLHKNLLEVVLPMCILQNTPKLGEFRLIRMRLHHDNNVFTFGKSYLRV